MTLKQVIEALVFASQKPISSKEICQILRGAGNESELAEAQDYAKVKEEEIVTLLTEMQIEQEAEGRPFHIIEKVTGWQFVTNPSCATWVRQLYPELKPTRLSAPALETLAIIAYRQPITRADIEAVRGVAVDGMVQTLLERGLIRIAGRAEVPGRPLLYETTQYFLEHFGLKKLDELPNAGELRRIQLPKAQPPAEPALDAKPNGKADANTGEKPEAASAAPAAPDAPAEAAPDSPAEPATEAAPETLAEPSIEAPSEVVETALEAPTLEPAGELSSESVNPEPEPPAPEPGAAGEPSPSEP